MKRWQLKGIYGQKDVLNLKAEPQKLEDLEFLKKQKDPGLFTNTDDFKTNGFLNLNQNWRMNKCIDRLDSSSCIPLERKLQEHGHQIMQQICVNTLIIHEVEL